MADHVDDLRIGDPAREEHADCELIRRVEGGRDVAAPADGLVGQAEGGEGVCVGALEGDLSQRIEVGLLAGHGPALRIIEGILDGQPHVRDAQLSHDPAVLIFHHGVDDALRVDQDLDAGGVDVKEPAGLDDLQPLVDQGRGVDRDLGAHGPGGVLEGVFGPDVLQFLRGPSAEGAARCREPDLRDPVARLSVEALENGAVLTVDRQDGDSLFGRQRHDDMPRGDQGLLVGQGDLFAALDRGDGRPDAHHAHDRGDEIFAVVHGGCLQEALHAREDLDVQVPDPVPEVGGRIGVVEDCPAGVELPDLGLHQIHAASGAEGGDLQVSLLPDDVKGLPADRTCGT